ncbi:acyl-CoA dehydrogenase [Rhizobiales bacterium GAS113]|jgi:acyl-CoA dehydrogenase|nr:acyl-CoA dehydrogenase [Rhizobiales bacterium GAS113]SEE63734.1 acyl-CoA dehydrogenase [Rhizobiales bacterium GAS188]
MTMVDMRIAKPAGPRAKIFDELIKSTGVSLDLKARVESAAVIAASAAALVDEGARFPDEAFAALREQRLLGILVPRELGGEGASISDVVDVCYRLGRACSSTAMIYAMHQTKVACLVRHGYKNPWHQRLLQRLCAEQLLLASSTTEGQGGGNVRSSEAPIESDGHRIALTRNAGVISYGAKADGIVTTARRSADASSSDQVLVAFLKEDYTLEPQSSWDTLGMRGTCSSGFILRATGEQAQILPDPYEKIHAQTMTPVAHLMWAGAWTGIATHAVDRARSFIRKASRQSGGQLPPGAAQFTKANSSLSTLRAVVASAVGRFEQVLHDERALGSVPFQAMINMTKVDASELAVTTVMSALRACGLSGYRNDGEFSVARHLRDVLSSPLMINNERIIANTATASLMSGAPDSLRE